MLVWWFCEGERVMDWCWCVRAMRWLCRDVQRLLGDLIMEGGRLDDQGSERIGCWS